jgi:lysophospholipase L1-like esterase
MYENKRITTESTVFLGDSLTEGFDLDYFFPLIDLVNRGISGDTTIQVSFRLDEIVNSRPARVFLMIGINDLFHGFSPEEVTSNIREIMERLKDTPGFFLQSILPVNETNLLVGTNLNTLIHETNNQLRRYCKGEKFTFLDFHSAFLNNSGQMDSKYTYDGAHLTHEGYHLWASLLKSYVENP